MIVILCLGLKNLKSHSVWFLNLFILLFSLVCTSAVAINIAKPPDLESGLPANTKLTKLGDEVYLNGIPAKVVGIAVPASIKETAIFFARKWALEGWVVTVDRNDELILVMSSNDTYQRVASLTKTGDASTEGSLSLTDFPFRLKNGDGYQLPVGKHLQMPVNSRILNEVRIKDQSVESILTTLSNEFNVEQNAAFYQERMVEQGWKEKRRKTVEEGKGVILIFAQGNKEATFMIVREKLQTFVTVNWVVH